MTKPRILVMDVDGTLTDGKLYMGEYGEVMKVFDIKDGYAIKEMLPKFEIIPVIITGRKSKMTEIRCNELGIKEVHQECTKKKEKMLEIARRLGLKITADHKIAGSAYIGDDLLDISGMNISELAGCPSDAVVEVKRNSQYICKHAGGNGAVREFIEWIITEQYMT